MEEEFYKELGKQLRNLRIASGMSQQDVGDQLGITFQQVQKYEKGTNRISSFTLWRLKQIFGTKWEAFFPGGRSSDSLNDITLRRAELEIVKGLNAIPAPAIKKALAALVAELSREHRHDAR